MTMQLLGAMVLRTINPATKELGWLVQWSTKGGEIHTEWFELFADASRFVESHILGDI